MISTTEEDEEDDLEEDDWELEREEDAEGDRARFDVFLFFFDFDGPASFTGADFSAFFFCERSAGFFAA